MIVQNRGTERPGPVPKLKAARPGIDRKMTGHCQFRPMHEDEHEEKGFSAYLSLKQRKRYLSLKQDYIEQGLLKNFVHESVLHRWHESFISHH